MRMKRNSQKPNIFLSIGKVTIWSPYWISWNMLRLLCLRNFVLPHEHLDQNFQNLALTFTENKGWTESILMVSGWDCCYLWNLFLAMTWMHMHSVTFYQSSCIDTYCWIEPLNNQIQLFTATFKVLQSNTLMIFSFRWLLLHYVTKIHHYIYGMVLIKTISKACLSNLNLR